VRLEGVAGGEAGGVGETNVEVEGAGRSPGGAMVAGPGSRQWPLRRVSPAVEGRGSPVVDGRGCVGTWGNG
jgi:hypothetical protein